MERLLRTLAPGLLSLTLVNAQGRAYATGEAWWNAGHGGVLPWDESYDNPDGQVTILNRMGAVRAQNHAFFEPLGTNGRARVTCHQPASNGWAKDLEAVVDFYGRRFEIEYTQREKKDLANFLRVL